MAASLGLDQSGIAELNARWKNEFFPSVKRVNPSAISMDNSYEFGEMVGKINHILSDGKKACLFIGRTAGEALPLKLHLETHFEHVELRAKEPFPYPTNWFSTSF